MRFRRTLGLGLGAASYDNLCFKLVSFHGLSRAVGKASNGPYCLASHLMQQKRQREVRAL